MPDKPYRVNDFLLDEEFQQWVKTPTSENDAYWQEFLRLHPEANEAAEEARRLILQLDFEVSPRSKEIKNKIKSAIDRAIEEDAAQPTPQDQKTITYLLRKEYHFPSRGRWIGLAASLTGFLLLLGTYFMFFPTSFFTEYTTQYGETKSIILPDRSMVTLNANSSLRVAEDRWDNLTERNVWLEGEAFFDVEKKETSTGKPAKFVVHSGKVQVEVLGTRFNVNSRRSETKVVLSEGKVKLNIQRDAVQGSEEVLMEPGEMVAVNQRRSEVEKRAVDPAQYTSWTKNKLVFDQTPIATIKQLIEDNYGISVSVEDSTLLTKAFTGVAPADDLDILLDKLSFVYNLNITRDEDKIIINEK